MPRGTRVLDVGCGNGFIAHHLTCLLGSTVVGLDVGQSTEARIPFLPYDGRHFPLKDRSFDAVLLCYVLHHAQDCGLVLSEISRVLKPGGLVFVYEDIPSGFWNKAVCWTHDRKWRHRTGPCTFRPERAWRWLFNRADFEILIERPLSRWRNFAHPVSRRLYVLRSKAAVSLSQADPRAELVTSVENQEEYAAA
jgi:ubiquinone/menaquinone biosynthesis C-methylase UbiE